MKVLLSWLREFAPFEGDPAVLGDTMSDLGMAVESLEAVGEGLDDVVVAEVLGLRPHPDADRVQLVDVDAGGGDASQIVCGAFNMAVGDRVPLARVGAVLPNGMEIGRRKLRGQMSNGMLCAPDELALGSDHDGILVLPDGLEPGTPLRDALGLEQDVLYELEINPNRPDALSVAGVARDLAARLGLPFALPDPRPVEVGAPTAEAVDVEIEAPDLCGRFLARVLRSVEVGASPAWLGTRLALCGMRPINRVVDVSNYVMLELGQPNHTYDLALVSGRRLGTRWARDGEHLVTLDGVERALEPTDGVIVDADDGVIGLAGVMGGASTEISERTRDVVLEMAWWEPMTVARTSARLGLRSEASTRFERGTDPEIVELAARRFCDLLGDAGQAAPGVVDRRGDLPPRAPVRVRPTRVADLLGVDLSADAITRYLEPIGFEVRPAGDDLDVVVPTYRPDTATETDVVEEVARHHGYGTIPRTLPSSELTGGPTAYQQERRRVRDVLVGVGCSEAMPLPFLAPGDLERAEVRSDAVVVTNPLDARESVLRTSLRPGLLRALAYNAAHRNRDVWLFEIGNVFARPADPAATLPEETEVFAVALGDREVLEASRVWQARRAALAVEDARLEQGPVPGLHPGRAGRLVVGREPVGVIGEIAPDVTARFEAPERVAWLEVDLGRLLALPHGARRYRPVSRYPSSDIDLAFEVDDAGGRRRGRGHPEGGRRPARGRPPVVRRVPRWAGRRRRRSLAFAVRLQAPDRTLTDEEVAAVRRTLIDAVEAGHPATLRG
ncbi:MAG: phenylalanine--tRNA ligase subunit beta [Acidimicrobiia bacterium]|nr:phenylalanine--tRNA ligase subunit beta [Acidimicrobiia bacterium]